MAATLVSELFKGCLLFALLFQAFIAPSLAANKDEWRNRSIYQILTDRFARDEGVEDTICEPGMGRRCGGTWRGIQNHLDYIQDMGFDAIWISPVVGNIPKRTALGDAYAGYWQQDLYSVNEEYGTEDDLHDLIEDVHNRGMLFMLDVVTNHMAWNGNHKDIDYSRFVPFNDKKYFHDFCLISDYTPDGDAIECWLGDSKKVPLPDLRTEDEEVREMFGDWISSMVSNYSIDGMRIDTVLHIEPDFFPGFMESAGIFGIGEVLTESTERSCQWEKTIGSVFNYAMYYAMKRAFAAPGTPMDGIINAINSTNENCDDSTTMGSFSENHDVIRFANQTGDMALAKNVIALTMLADGIPVIFQGQEQHESGGVHPYMNRSPLWEAGYDKESTLYLHIQTLNAIRHHAIRTSYNYTTYPHYAIYSEDSVIALRKGNTGSQVVTVLTSDGENHESYDLDLSNHGFNASVTEIFTCEEYEVGDDGVISLPMESGQPRVLYPSDLLYGSGLCEYDDEVPDDVPYPQQTTISTAFPTTISGDHGTYSTAMTSPLPGPFQTAQAEASATGADEEPTETSGGFTSDETGSGESGDESGAAAAREMSSTLAMAVLIMVLCCL